LLEPILEDMTKTGRSARAPRPWLGLYATEAGARLVVAGLAPNGPAEKAGVKVGDVIVDVDGDKPLTLADLWRRVWRVGPPGVEVHLKLFRKDRAVDARLLSGDRSDFLKKPHLH
jgi:S1-C subfamily serine protease